VDDLAVEVGWVDGVVVYYGEVTASCCKVEKGRRANASSTYDENFFVEDFELSLYSKTFFHDELAGISHYLIWG